MKFKIEIEAEGVDELNALIRGLGNVYPNHSENPLKVTDVKPVLHTGGVVKVDDLPFVGEKVLSTPVKADAVSTTYLPSEEFSHKDLVHVSVENTALPTSLDQRRFEQVAVTELSSSTPDELENLILNQINDVLGDGKQLPAFTGVDLTSEDNEINLGSVHTIDVSSGVELDVNGLPWDERIHAGSKAKLASGAWRSRRGVSDELVKQVEAELRGTPTPVAADTPLEQAIAEAIEPQPVQEFPASEAARLSSVINTLFATKAIDIAYLTTLVKAIDDEFLDVTVNSITDIMHDAEMIEFAFEQLRTDGKIS